MLPMTESLTSLLRQRSIENLFSDAELIRDWPEGEQRLAAAKRLIRSAMYRTAVGEIAERDRSAIFALLEFALP